MSILVTPYDMKSCQALEPIEVDSDKLQDYNSCGFRNIDRTPIVGSKLKTRDGIVYCLETVDKITELLSNDLDDLLEED